MCGDDHVVFVVCRWCLMMDAGMCPPSARMCPLSALMQSISSIPALYSNSSAAAKTILTKRSKSRFVAYPSRSLLCLCHTHTLSLLAPTLRGLLRACINVYAMAGSTCMQACCLVRCRRPARWRMLNSTYSERLRPYLTLTDGRSV